MAQRDTKSTATKERPSSIKLQTSLSQPASSNSTKEQKPNTRRHQTLPEPLNQNYVKSDAELYIALQSQRSLKSNDVSPETPISPSSSGAGATANPFQPSMMSFNERMQRFYQERTKKAYKKQKHQYVYGPPPSASNFPSFLATFPPPSTHLTQALLAERNTTPQPRLAIKKNNLIDRPKTSETRNTMKIPSPI